MAQKAKRQTSKDLVRRYAQETLAPEVEINPEPVNEALARLSKSINRVVLLPINLLVIEDNVRKILDTESAEFQSLVDSIRSGGVRQSIIVDLRVHSESEFSLIVLAGQRRFLAARIAGVTEIACLLLKSGGKAEQVAVGLEENILRENLHPLDLADAYQSLVTEGWSKEEISEKFERGKKTIEQYLRLARFPETAKAIIRANRDRFTSFVLFQRFVAKRWKDDDELLEALQGYLDTPLPVKKQSQADEEMGRLAEAVKQNSGLPCKIKGTRQSGELRVKFSNEAEFDFLWNLFSREK
jgi:ParB family chromosome partitioning protein